MFGQAALRNPTSRVTELMRNLRDLETRIRYLDPRDATRASADVTESVGTALEDIAERFRNGAGYAAREAVRMGHRANVAGRDSYEFLKSEVDAHPLAVLAVAAGIGILIGASVYRQSRNASPEPKQRRRIKRKARK
jgi:ElaB/YqjD/DUF883 family membrane-anchored ribosome-binding protein